jgi:hypothetical protein
MTRYASPIVRMIVEVIWEERKKYGGVRGVCKMAGLGYSCFYQWRSLGFDPKLSNAEAMLNAVGFTLVALPMDNPPP